MQSNVAQITSLWESVEARAWDRMNGHFSPDAVMEWPVTSERFLGAEGIVAVNQEYPEGWSTHVLAVEAMADGRVVAKIRVDHGSQSFYDVAFYTFSEGLICYVEEYWATQEEPESWRNESLIPGWSRMMRR